MVAKNNLHHAGLPPPVLPSSWHEFDNFPPIVREVLRESPYDYSTGEIARSIQLYGVKTTVGWLVRGNVENIRNSALQTYGPDHPQAAP